MNHLFIYYYYYYYFFHNDEPHQDKVLRIQPLEVRPWIDDSTYHTIVCLYQKRQTKIIYSFLCFLVFAFWIYFD